MANHFLSRSGLTLHAASQDFNLLIPSGPGEGMNCQGQSWQHWFDQKNAGEAGEASHVHSLPYEEANSDAASHGFNAWIRMRYKYGNCLYSPFAESGICRGKKTNGVAMERACTCICLRTRHRSPCPSDLLDHKYSNHAVYRELSCLCSGKTEETYCAVQLQMSGRILTSYVANT